MAMCWSMGPWAGLERRHIWEACRSSLMSNLPHQKTFIPINKAFGKGALCRLSTVLIARGSVGDCICTCARQGICWCVCMLCMEDARFCSVPCTNKSYLGYFCSATQSWFGVFVTNGSNRKPEMHSYCKPVVCELWCGQALAEFLLHAVLLSHSVSH